jgi:hypothetical protein
MAQLQIDNLDFVVASGVLFDVTYCTIFDSTATGDGTPIDASDASNVDSGGNSGWIIDPPMIGVLDNLMVFSSPLTDDESDFIYNNKATYNDLDTSTDPDNPGVPAAIWKLDETNGVRMDASGNGYHLTPDGAARGVKFDRASNQYAEIDTAVVTDYPLSMTASFKTTSATDQAIVQVADKDVTARYHGILCRSGTDVKLYVNGIDECTVSANYDDGSWHWYCSTSSAIDDHLLDVDGSTDTGSGYRTLAGVDRTSLGRFGDSTPGYYSDGTLDNVAIWNISLSAAQRLWLRTGGKTGGPATYQDVCTSDDADNPGVASVAAWWKLNEASGTTLVNVHNPGTYDLTMQNGPTLGSTGHVTDLPCSVAGTVEEIAEIDGFVSKALDQTSNGNDLAQTTYSKRPQAVSVSDGNALQFDGVDDLLTITTLAGGKLTSGGAVFVVANFDAPADGANNVIFDGGNASGDRWLFYKNTGDDLVIFQGTNKTGSAADGDLHVFVAKFAATDKLYVDGGAADVSDNALSNDLDGLTLGANFNDSGSYLSGKIRQLAVWDGAITDDQINTIAAQLASEHGLTWTDVS